MGNVTSVAAFAAMVAALFGQYFTHALLAQRPPFIAVQVGAVLLMIAARLTFGLRSFHATASPTAGGVVSSGPYAFWRHPIYSAVIYFLWAGALDALALPGMLWALVGTAGAVVRMLLEERMLVARYPEYRAYMTRTRRVIPFVI